MSQAILAEQDALYEQGRTKPGPIVTNARGGYSNHNFGLAFDITLFSIAAGQPIYEHPLYTSVAPIGKALGLTWGGEWSRPDEPHYELRPPWAMAMSENEMISELRRRKACGVNLLT